MKRLICLVLGHKVYYDDIAGGTIFECCERCKHTKLVVDFVEILESE